MWEYKVAETDLHGGSIAGLLKSYTEFELVQVIPVPNINTANCPHVILIFKRPATVKTPFITAFKLDPEEALAYKGGKFEFKGDIRIYPNVKKD